MSTTIDERVVEMQFDNKNFEKNVSQTMSTLDKLKAKLNFGNEKNSISELEEAGRDFNLDGMSNAVEAVGKKFSILEEIAIGSLRRIGSMITDKLAGYVDSFTVAPVRSGWDQYAEKTSAVQTIMAATRETWEASAKEVGFVGDQMDYVNAQLEKLTWFTDETSYNFNDMVGNIGKFTANGIGLNEAVTSMEGIATWAGLSGANVQEASRAMYNFSQAMGAGSMKLQDWKSIENANMATTEFKQTVIDTALELGTIKKVGDDLYQAIGSKNTFSLSSFSTDLTSGWFDKGVMQGALDRFGRFTDELSKFQDLTSGYYDTTSQILQDLDRYDGAATAAEKLEILKEVSDETGLSIEELTESFEYLNSEELNLGKRAFKASQEAKTFKEAIEATATAVSSAWSKVFETIFGDYEDAKVVWTNLSNELWDVFAGPINGLNDLLVEWAEAKTAFDINEFGEIFEYEVDGGRAMMFEAIANSWEGLKNILGAVKEAFQNVFPPMTAKRLLEITERIRDFTAKLKNGSENTENFRKALEMVFTVFKLLLSGIGAVLKGFTPLVDGFAELFGYLMKVAAVDHDQAFALLNSAKVMEFFGQVTERVSSVVKIFADLINELAEVLFVSYWEGGGGLPGLFEVLFVSADSVIDAIMKIISTVTGIDLSGLSNGITSFIFAVKNVVVGFADIIQSFFIGALFGAREEVDEFGNTAQSKLGIIEMLAAVFQKLGKAIQSLFGSLNRDRSEPKFEFLTKILSFLSTIGRQISEAVGFLWDSLKVGFGRIKELLSSIDLSNLKELVKIGSIAATGVAAFKVLDYLKEVVWAFYEKFTGYSFDANFILKIAAAIGIFALSAALLASIDAAGLARATAAITTFVYLLDDAMSKLSKNNNLTRKKMFAILGAVTAMIGISTSMVVVSLALKVIGSMSWDEIARGLTGLLGAMLIMTTAIEKINDSQKFITQQSDPRKSASAMITMAVSMIVVAIALKKIGEMGWEEIAKGITGMMASMFIMVAGLRMLDSVSNSKNANALLPAAISLLLISSVMKKIGDMEWESIAKGCTGMFASMLLMVAGLTMLDEVDNPKNALALLPVAISMLLVSSVLQKIGEMGWEEIAKGVTGMMTSMLLIAAEMSMLDNIQQNPSDAAGAMLIMSVSMLLIASVLKKIGDMEWEGIAKGLAGLVSSMALMVAALAIMDKFSANPTESAVAILAVSAAMLLLSVAMKALGNMSWESIIKGFVGMAGVLALIVGAAYAVGPAIVPLAVLSETLLAISLAAIAFSVAAIGFAIAITAVVTALSALAAIGPAAMTVIVASLKTLIIGVLNFVPDITTSFVKALSAMIDAVAGLIPSIVSHFGTLVTSLLDLIIRLIPKLAEVVGKIFDAILELIAKYVPVIANMVLDLITMILIAIRMHLPLIIQVGVDIILALMNGIAAAIPRIAESAVNIIIAFIDAVATQSVRLVDAAFDAMITFINGMADAIEENMAPLIEAVMHLGEAIIIGLVSFVTGEFPVIKDLGEALMNSQFVQGIRDNIGGLLDTAKQFMSDFGQKIKDKYEEIKGKGKETLQKFIDGARSIFDDLRTAANDMVDTVKTKIGDKIGEIYDKGKELVNKFVQGLKDAWDEAKEFVIGLWENLTGADEAIPEWEYDQTERYNSELEHHGSGGRLPSEDDYSPSSVPSGIAAIAASASKTAETVGAMKSTELASDVGAAFNRGRAFEADSSAGPRINNYNYTQNINSPKPIDNETVYRNTKNQISRMKAEVGA